MAEVTFSFLIEGGRATAGVPIGVTLGPLGVNVQAVVTEINNKTKDFEGVSVPVKIAVDKEKKTFKIEIGAPSVASLIKKEIGIEKGAKGEAGQRPPPAGDITMEGIMKIAKIKMEGMNVKDIRAAVISVLGTCTSVGVTCNGKNPKEVIQEIRRGEHEIK